MIIPILHSPITEAYHSAVAFAGHPQFAEQLVTRAEYLEGGSNACRRKFRDWRSSDEAARDEQQAQPKAKGKGKQKDDTGRADPGKAGGKGKGRTSLASARRR